MLGKLPELTVPQLPEPLKPSRTMRSSTFEVLFLDEVEWLQRLNDALDPVIDDLKDADESVYLADPRWPEVVGRAVAAAQVMRGNDRPDSTDPHPPASRPNSVGPDPYAPPHG